MVDLSPLAQLGAVGVMLGVQIYFWQRAQDRADRQYQAMLDWNQKMVGSLLEALGNVTRVLEKIADRVP